MSRHNKVSFTNQQGKVSLQSIFWIVGIIVGLLTILQIVLPYVQNDDKQITTEDSPEPSDSTTDTSKEPKPSALDSPSTKIDKFIAYDNGIAVDKSLGIVWMRCSLGQEWNGTNCEGSAKAYTLEEAQQAIDQLNKVSYVGLYDWKIPNIEAMHSLIECSDGYEGSYSIPMQLSGHGEKEIVAVDCAGDSTTPAINQNVFPDTQWAVWRGYLSSTKNEQGEILAVYFNDGKIKSKDKAHYIRPMRLLN